MSSISRWPRLSRQLIDGGTELPPARIVHIGLGAFHRAHQAWYTAGAPDRADWGIAAFAGRSDKAADALAPQGGLFTLVERGPLGDRFEHVDSIVGAYGASQVRTLIDLLARPTTALVTLTVTEAGYGLSASGAPDLLAGGLDRDIHALRAASSNDELLLLTPQTTLGRILTGLELRRRTAPAHLLAIVPCDNFPANGERLRQAFMELACDVSPMLGSWLSSGTSFVSTSVDRITPRVDATLSDVVARETGWWDESPVATEPFSDWTLSGEFPAGRPEWEERGALFVSDLEPYELRKLRLLNGAHSLLAYFGQLRGHRTVAEAMSDDACVAAVEAWWEEAIASLPQGIEVRQYRAELRKRFQNVHVEHSLAQIASDGVTKLGLRVAPVATFERRHGRPASAAAASMAAWIATVHREMTTVDSRSEEIGRARSSAFPAQALLELVSPELAGDRTFVRNVTSVATDFAQGVIDPKRFREN